MKKVPKAVLMILPYSYNELAGDEASSFDSLTSIIVLDKIVDIVNTHLINYHFVTHNYNSQYFV